MNNSGAEALSLLEKRSGKVVKGGNPEWRKGEPSLARLRADNERQDTKHTVTDI